MLTKQFNKVNDFPGNCLINSNSPIEFNTRIYEYDNFLPYTLNHIWPIHTMRCLVIKFHIKIFCVWDRIWPHNDTTSYTRKR